MESLSQCPDIMKMLLLTAFSRFFVMGVTLVGLPFLVRNVLGLDAKFYGGAESALAVAIILGSAAAGFLTGKLTSGRRSCVLVSIGVCIGLAGVVFLLPSGVPVRYADKMFSVGAAALTGQFLLRHVCPCMLQYPKKKEGASTWETRRLHKEYSGI